MKQTRELEYSFTDYTDYDPGRGGPTPTWTFRVSTDNVLLEVEVRGECYDDPENLQSKNEVLGVLLCRLNELRSDVEVLEGFITAVKLTSEFDNGTKEEDD